MSRLAGPTQANPFLPYCPAKTPGPTGINDSGDPNVISELGDTPGSLGINDHAAVIANGDAMDDLHIPVHHVQARTPHLRRGHWPHLLNSRSRTARKPANASNWRLEF